MSGSSSSTIPPVEPITPIPDIDKIPEVTDIAPLDVPAPVAPPANIKNKKAVPWFLPEVKDSNLMKNRGAVVEANLVTPLVDGEAIFTELETQLEKAEKSILVGFWSIDPHMKMVTNAKKRWGDLLIDKAASGVMVRIFFTDFEPGLRALEHMGVWVSYKQLVHASTSIPPDKFQVLCSLQEAEISDTMVSGLLPGIYDSLPASVTKFYADKVDKLIAARKLKASQRKEVIANLLINYYESAPGIWDKVEINTSTSDLVPKTPKKDYPVFPGVHHQKTVIIDGAIAYTGGLNITDVYNDNRKHTKKVNPETKVGPWHDAFVKVEGGFALKQFIENYVGLWNQERKRSDAFLTNAYKSSTWTVDRTADTRATTDLSVSAITSSVTSTVAPSIPGQVRRTVSVKSSSILRAFDTIRKDVLEGYLLAIKQAESYIYIENQYFREKAIGDAIIAQHAAKPGLRTIIVLPDIPEELLASKGDLLTKHGVHLQHGILDAMKTAIKDNLGLYTMKRKDNVQIYVHSKLMLIDDKFGSIGSANANPRSYRLDTELDFVWYDEKIVKALREDLWNEWLGKPAGMSSWASTDYIKQWNKIAKKNPGLRRKQKGFVFLFDNKLTGEATTMPVDDFV